MVGRHQRWDDNVCVPAMITRPQSRWLAGDQHGTAAILVAFSLVLLMGFAAFAVDAAAAWALRRQDQSGADTGALAGAILTAELPKPAAMLAAENEIIRITYSTMSPDMTAAEWAAEWAACSDPSKPPVFTDTLNSDCISFTSNLSRIRVQTPTVPWNTSFARVIGIDQINTSAFAEVGTVFAGIGGVLPFGLPSGAAGNTEICLKTGANPQNSAPCDGPVTGNFGFLDFTEYGDVDGNGTLCTGGGTDRLARNIARGIDHFLGVSSTFPATDARHESTGCSDTNLNYRPNIVNSNTGNVAQVLDHGFAEGISGVPGRLTQIAPVVGSAENVRGHVLDDTPLWTWLNGSGPASCTTVTNHDEMITCIDDWKAGGYGVIFTDDILNSPRFGWVPLVWNPTLGTGTTGLTIKDALPVFIQTTFWGCNASGCDVEWDPGNSSEEPDASNGPNNKRIEAATTILLPAGTLPPAVFEFEPGTDRAVSYLLER